MNGRTHKLDILETGDRASVRAADLEHATALSRPVADALCLVGDRVNLASPW